MKTMIVKAATVCLVLGIVLSFGNEAEAKTVIKRSSESDESHDNEECTAAKEEQSRMIKVVIKCVIEYLSSSIVNIGGINIGKSSTSNTVFGKWSTLPGVSSCITTNFPHDPKLTMEKYQEKCKSSKGNEAGAGTVTKEIAESHDNQECTAAKEELKKPWEAITEFRECITKSVYGKFGGLLGGIKDKLFNNELPNIAGVFPSKTGVESGWPILRKPDISFGVPCIFPDFTALFSIWEKVLKTCPSDILGGPAVGGGIDIGKSRSK